MKRDMELIRHLLFAIEEIDTAGDYTAFKKDEAEIEFADKYGNSWDNIRHQHLELLIEAKLIEGMTVNSTDGTMLVMPKRLTWSGHEYLNSIRDANAWKYIRTKLNTLGVWTLPIVQQLAGKYAEKVLGLG